MCGFGEKIMSTKEVDEARERVKNGEYVKLNEPLKVGCRGDIYKK